MLPVIRIPAPLEATASMIIIHGLGDSGDGWTFMADQFQKHKEFQHINFIFPSAPASPLHISDNQPVSHWFDIFEMGNPHAKQDEIGFWNSCGKINDLIHDEMKHGIPSNRIVVGGFSQGAVISLGMAVSCDEQLGGIVDMSGIFAMRQAIDKHLTGKNFNTPIFHGHGDVDPVFNIEYARDTASYFRHLGFKDYEFHEYVGMVHTTNDEEMLDIEAFLKKVIPSTL